MTLSERHLVINNSLFGFPPPWADPRLQDIHLALASTIYRDSDIVHVVTAAGLSPADVPWNGSPRAIWHATIHEASGHQRLPELLNCAAARQPQLRVRFAELLADRPAVSAPVPERKPPWRNFSTNGLERRIVQEQDTLLDVVFLQRGVDQAKAVCRLTASFDGRRLLGTGFRIGARTILTNHHVVYETEQADRPAQSVLAEFGYELDLDGNPGAVTAIRCEIESIVAEKEHDFAVLRTSEEIPPNVTTLHLSPTKVDVDARVYIVQHPRGLRKKVALAHNLVRYADDDVVQYWTDTEGGSSGSPVFDDHWNVVALHHQWVESPGDVYTYRNQGRAIGRVVERMAALGLEPDGSPVA